MFSQDQDAITTIENHIKNIIGDDRILDENHTPTEKHNYEFFMDWISFQVQNPGQLLHFAPLIYGISGCGKSFFLHLLKTILSDKEVQLLSYKEVKSRLNSHTIDRLVNVIDVVNTPNERASFVLDQMQDYITNDTIIINKWKRPNYESPNHTNYLLMAHDVKHLPLEDPESRYWIILSPITLEDLTNHYTKDYFTKLFQALEHKEILRDYFLNRRISQEFLNYNRAPRVYTKNILQEYIRVHAYGYEEAMELIAQESKYYNKKLIISRELFLDLEKKGIQIRSKTAKRKFIESLHYIPYNAKMFRYETYNESRMFIKDTLYHDDLTRADLKVLYKHALDKNSD